MVPGTVVDIDGASGICTITYPFEKEEVDSIFAHKRRYLEGYQARKRPLIQSIRMSWPKDKIDILPAIKKWFEPLLELADITCRQINARVLLDCSPKTKVVIDFVERKVSAWRRTVPVSFFYRSLTRRSVRLRAL